MSRFDLWLPHACLCTRTQIHLSFHEGNQYTDSKFPGLLSLSDSQPCASLRLQDYRAWTLEDMESTQQFIKWPSGPYSLLHGLPPSSSSCEYQLILPETEPKFVFLKYPPSAPGQKINLNHLQYENLSYSKMLLCSSRVFATSGKIHSVPLTFHRVILSFSISAVTFLSTLSGSCSSLLKHGISWTSASPGGLGRACTLNHTTFCGFLDVSIRLNIVCTAFLEQIRSVAS